MFEDLLQEMHAGGIEDLARAFLGRRMTRCASIALIF